MNGSSDYLVTVCCIAYNHEAYIEKALQGIVDQKLDGPMEILVNDDASTDRTQEIIRTFRNRYPDLISPVHQVENQLSQGKGPFPQLIRKAKGEFIALCEGDDYWTDKHKLQKQVDMMRSHPEASVCHHNTDILFEDSGEVEARYQHYVRPVCSFDHLILRNGITTVSSLLRRQAIHKEEQPGFRARMRSGDRFLHLQSTQAGGTIVYLPERMAVYRRHSRGQYSSISRQQKLERVFADNEVMKFHFGTRAQKLFNLRNTSILFVLVRVNLGRRKIFSALKTLLQAFKFIFLNRVNPIALIRIHNYNPWTTEQSRFIPGIGRV